MVLRPLRLQNSHGQHKICGIIGIFLILSVPRFCTSKYPHLQQARGLVHHGLS